MQLRNIHTEYHDYDLFNMIVETRVTYSWEANQHAGCWWSGTYIGARSIATIMMTYADRYDIDGLVQGRRYSIANGLELRISCTNPSIWNWSKYIEKTDIRWHGFSTHIEFNHLPY